MSNKDKIKELLDKNEYTLSSSCSHTEIMRILADYDLNDNNNFFKNHAIWLAFRESEMDTVNATSNQSFPKCSCGQDIIITFDGEKNFEFSCW